MKGSLSSTYFLVMWVTSYLVSTFCLFWRVVILGKFESPSKLLVLQSFCWHHFLIYFFFFRQYHFFHLCWLFAFVKFLYLHRVFRIGIINRHYSHRQPFLLKLHLCSALFSLQHYFLSFLSVFLSSFLTSQLPIFVKYHMIYQLRTWVQQSYIFAVGELKKQMTNRFWKKYCD